MIKTVIGTAVQTRCGVALPAGQTKCHFRPTDELSSDCGRTNCTDQGRSDVQNLCHTCLHVVELPICRTPHIHVKVKLGQRELLTTQLYVAGDAGNAQDFLWRRLSEPERTALTIPFSLGSDGLRARFPIHVAT